MKVALYARVSSDDQADRDTIADQVTLFEKWVDLHGHTDAGRFLDDGVTGTLPMPQRPAGAQLLELLRAGQIEAIAFKNVKRLGRKTRVVLDFIDQADIASVALISITEPFDTSSPIGRFIVTVLASISELDRENILEQTRAGMRRRAREGGFLGGKCAYGYRIEGRRHQAHLEIDHSESGAGMSKPQLVIQLYEALAGGSSCDAQAQALNRQGVPSASGGLWSPAVVARMIQNPVYRGQHRYGDSVEGSILPESYAPAPPIVSHELWTRANDQIERNRRLRGKPAERLYLLRGLLWCGTCGHAYTGQTTNKDLAERTDHAQGVIYRCNWRVGGHRKRTNGTPCDSPSVSGGIEGRIWSMCEAILASPDAVRAGVSQDQDTPTTDTSALERALEEREAGRSRVLALYRRNRISEQELDEQLDEIQMEIAALRAEIDGARFKAEQSALVEQARERALVELQRIAQAHGRVLDTITREEKATIINKLVERVIVERDEAGAVSYNVALRVPPPEESECDSAIYSEGQINLLQQIVSEWDLSDIEKRVLKLG